MLQKIGLFLYQLDDLLPSLFDQFVTTSVSSGQQCIQQLQVGMSLVQRLNHRLDVTDGVLADDCKAQLQAFFQRRRLENT